MPQPELVELVSSSSFELVERRVALRTRRRERALDRRPLRRLGVGRRRLLRRARPLRRLERQPLLLAPPRVQLMVLRRQCRQLLLRERRLGRCPLELRAHRAQLLAQLKGLLALPAQLRYEALVPWEAAAANLGGGGGGGGGGGCCEALARRHDRSRGVRPELTKVRRQLRREQRWRRRRERRGSGLGGGREGCGADSVRLELLHLPLQSRALLLERDALATVAVHDRRSPLRQLIRLDHRRALLLQRLLRLAHFGEARVEKRRLLLHGLDLLRQLGRRVVWPRRRLGWPAW